jgi:hypothetical protein
MTHGDAKQALAMVCQTSRTAFMGLGLALYGAPE